MVQRRVGPHRGVVRHVLVDPARPAHGRARKGPHRPRRQRVDPDALGPQVVGEIAHRRLQRRLGDAHDVVVRHDPLRAEIGHGDDRAAPLHQRQHPPGHVHQRIAGDVERLQEVRPRGVGEAALKLVLVGKGDGVDQEIHMAPGVRQLIAHRVERGLVLHVRRHQVLHPQRIGQRLHPLAEILALIGESQLRAMFREHLGHAPGDGVIVGDAHDKPALAGHKTLVHLAHSLVISRGTG